MIIQLKEKTNDELRAALNSRDLADILHAVSNLERRNLEIDADRSAVFAIKSAVDELRVLVPTIEGGAK